MHRSSSIIRHLLVALSFWGLVRADDATQATAEPSPTALRDEWHLIYLGSEPVGYIHRTVRPRAGGGYRVIDSQKLALKRRATRVELETHSSVEEGPDGRILGFRVLQKESGVTVETTATRASPDGELILRERTPGKPVRSWTLSLPRDTLGPIRAVETMRDRLREAGDAIELRILRPAARDCVKQRTVLGRTERVTLPDGTERVLRRLKVSQPGLESTRWVDERFDLHKSSTPLFGQSLVTYRTTRRKVLERDLSSPPEVFVSSFVTARGSVPSRAEEVHYRLRWNREAAGGPVAPATDSTGQSITRRTDREVDLTVRRVHPGRAAQSTEEDLGEYLRANRYLQTDDSRLSESARRIAAPAPDVWSAARSLARWVHETIKDKGLDTVFASASEVLDNRRGDCSEHAVLLAAACRVVGIPSRVAAGLVFREGAFVGHMWVEVHIGVWVPLDATLEDPTVYADHISFGSSSLEGSGLMDLSGTLARVIGNLEIEVRAASRESPSSSKDGTAARNDE